MKKIFFTLFLATSIFAFAQKEPASLRQLDSLVQISRNLTGQREFDKAFEANQQAEKFAIEKFGTASEGYARAIYNHGRVFYQKANYQEAEKWYLQSLEIRKSVVGDSSLEYANSTFGLGLVNWRLGQYQKSEAYFLETKAIRGKLLGTENVKYADVLSNLANVHYDRFEFDQCEKLNLEVLAIYEKVLGKNDPDYAGTLSNLGNLYQNMNYYEKAEPLQREALEIRGRVLGREHPEFAQSLNNLGVVNLYMGKYDVAEPLFNEALRIRTQKLGNEHPTVAQTMSNLATLHNAIGNYDLAEKFFTQAKDIRGKTLGKQHPAYGFAQKRLAEFYASIEQSERGEPNLLEAKSIWEKNMSHDDEYAAILFLLGNIYLHRGDLAQAKPLFETANNILQKMPNADNSLVALGLLAQADYFFKINDFAQAEQLYLQTKQFLEKILGKEHLNYAKTLRGLAKFYWQTRKSDDAKTALAEAAQITKKLLSRGLLHLSEQEMGDYLRSFEQWLDLDFSFANSEPSFAAVCFDDMLFYKGFLLSSVLQIQQSASRDPASLEKFNTLKSYRRRLAAEYSKPIVGQKNTPELEEKANTLEKDLARTVANFGAATQQVSWQQVQKKLLPNEVAIEFVDYQFSNPKPTDERKYAALVLRPDATEPVFVPLFEEKKLQALLDPAGKSKVDFVNNLYSNSAIFDLVWQPLESKISAATTIYFSPSGLLHRLNFGAFSVGNQTLADKYRLVSLGSTRQLVVPTEAKSEEKTALLFGGIQYDLDSTAFAAANSNLTQNLDKNLSENFLKNELATRRGLGFENVDSTLRGGDSWNFLKWTEVEIDLAASILQDANFKIDLKKDFAASEDFFKTIGTDAPSPKILHLATHGFFFPEVRNENVRGESEPIFKISEHPMIRSGLVLAAANHAWKTGKPAHSDREDGILTAYEISQMNLSNTELVVLSACETGLGDLRGNEGVYGLQRAFRIAGAKYLVMSLWQTSDFHTQELMSNFYSRWLDDKMPIPDAFRAAQAAMRSKFRDPFLWAGFVLIGG